MQHPLMMFAAGFGTRMRPLTLERPKPLVEVAGRSLIDHTLGLARAINPAPIVVNAHYLPDQIEAHFAGSDVECLVERPDILETGGGLKLALPRLGPGPVITTNTDMIWLGPNPFELMVAAWDAEVMDALLICVPVAHVHGHPGAGDFVLDADRRITRGRDYVYGGIQIVKQAPVAQVPERVFSLNVVWDDLIAQGRLVGLPYPGAWVDIGTPAGIALAEDLMANA